MSGWAASTVPARLLPTSRAAGDLVRPVPQPTLRVGDGAFAAFARSRAALRKANGQIVSACCC